MKKFKLIKVSVFATCRACVFDADQRACSKHVCSHLRIYAETRRYKIYKVLAKLISYGRK